MKNKAKNQILTEGRMYTPQRVILNNLEPREISDIQQAIEIGSDMAKKASKNLKLKLKSRLT